jgi:uncharacterized repeat protein (TIGR03803 family)
MATIRGAERAGGRFRIPIGTLLAAMACVTPYGAARAQAPYFRTLVDFNGTDGSTPVADLVAGPSGGVLYGTTLDGGKEGFGTVFSLTPPAAGGKWTETVLHSFKGGPGDGANPAGSLWFDASANTLYGTTLYGGKGSCDNLGGATGCGTVFSLTPPKPPATAWTEKVLYSFLGDADGANPSGTLTMNAGVLYGTTITGGEAAFCTGCGTVFALPLGGKESAIYVFGAVEGDGANPNSGVVVGALAPQLLLYGTTINGGTMGGECGSTGCGTVFALTQVSSVWGESGRQSFDFTNGANPYAGLAISSGVLYGTTYAGGIGTCAPKDPEAAPGCGTIFQVLAQTGGELGEVQTLYAFPGGSNGTNPYAGVTFAPGNTGVLYGTAVSGGEHSNGTLFQLTLSGNALGVLHPFTGGTGGSIPLGGVIFGNDGNLYGTTAGTAAAQDAAAKPHPDQDDAGTAFSLQCTKVPQCCGKGC